MVLDIDKGTLKNAEGFDKDNWLDFASPEWGQRLHDYYGYSPCFERSF